jgi:hypothetical protein
VRRFQLAAQDTRRDFRRADCSAQETAPDLAVALALRRLLARNMFREGSGPGRHAAGPVIEPDEKGESGWLCVGLHIRSAEDEA